MCKNPRWFPWFLMAAIITSCVNKKDAWELYSPEGNVSIQVRLKPSDETKSSSGSLIYSVKLDEIEILPPSPMGITGEGKNGDFSRGLKFVRQYQNIISETYSMPVGKKSVIKHQGNEQVLVYLNDQGQQIELHLRAYHDGIAYRYHIPGEGDMPIHHENSGFQIPEGSKAWLQSYVPHYERYYIPRIIKKTYTPPELNHYQEFYHEIFKDQTPGGDYAFPLLARIPSGQWIFVSEAATYGDYCGCRLYEDPDDASLLRVRLDGPVKSKLSLTTPWRVIMVGNTLKPIVESCMILNLNPPSELENTEWIRPGMSTFPWLSDHGINSNLARLKQFVDFAAEMGWKWIEFDNALAFGIDTGSRTPFATWMSIPWIPEFIAYATSKGIRVTGWDNWNNLDTQEKRDSILGYYQQHGFSGIKVDFLNADTQEMYQFRDEIIRDCAERKLMISFHGATLPRGQQRRWPHLATWEGVLGEESYTYPRGMPTPEHNATLCFTRNVAGSMDYTPSSFTQPGYPGFERTTTDAHQMALAVVFESGWQNIGATPEGMAGTRAREFMKGLPAAWDDIHFIDGYPDDYCVLARRKGHDWYLAGINTGEERTLSISLDFLKTRDYRINLFTDDAVGKVMVKELQVHTQTPLDIQLIPNGGFGVVFYDSYEE